MKGLVFMHQQGVAHRCVEPALCPIYIVIIMYRDCAFKNILMDANSLYPNGFHPVMLDRLPDNSDDAPVLSRAQRPVKYYYVDFGISVCIPSDSQNKLVVGTLGRDQDVPELSTTVPYDPFKVDVFIIGNLLLKTFERVCTYYAIAWIGS